MNKHRAISSTLAILALIFVAVGYNNCGTGKGPQETITGNPLVEIAFGPWGSAPDLKTFSFCVSKVNFTLNNSAPYPIVVNPNVEILLETLGAEFGKVNVPAGSYIKIDFELSSFCESGKSMRIKNANGTFETTSSLGISFTGNINVTETGTRLVMNTQPLVDAVKNITDSSQIATAVSAVAGSFSPETLPLSLTVAPVYPQNSDWMDFVKNDDVGQNKYSQDDVACDGTETGTLPCVNGGELKKVAITGRNSCTNLGLLDSLNAFDWECIVTAGTATFYSKGLKLDKGLRELLTSSGWRTIKVIVREGSNPVAESAETTWWNNPVQPLPANSSGSVIKIDGIDDDGAGPDQIFSAGTMLYYDSSRSTVGYNINLDRVGLVGLNLSTLTFVASATNCNSTTGETSAPDRRCMISVGNQKFVWIEALLDANNIANHPVLISQSSFSGLKNTIASKGLNSGLTIDSSHNIYIADAITSQNADDGLSVSSSPDNIFVGLISSTNGGEGVSIANSSDNQIYLSLISNNTSTGVRADSSIRTLISLSIVGGGSAGIDLSNSSDSKVELTSVQSATGDGVSVRNNSTGTKLSVVISANNGGNGFNIDSSDEILMSGLKAYNNGSSGIRVNNSNDVIGALLVSSFNSSNGINILSSSAITLSNINSISNSSDGVASDSNNGTFNQLLLSNNGGSGLSLAGDSNKVLQINSAHNVAGVELNNSSSNTFSANLVVGSNTADCTVSGGTNPGLTSACANQGSSNANLVTGLTHANSFVGKISTTDTYNATNTNGTQAYSSSSNWVSFINYFRYWGKDGGAFPDSANRGACTSGTCRIWDSRLVSTDTRVLNRSGNGSTANGVFTVGAACPSAVTGNRSASDQQSTANTFLLNAIESLLDGTGDEDGLCESNETCIYAPNFGFYQGETSTAGACTFTNGAVTGVTVNRYTSNGI
jgi:hypothetical protein